MKKFLFAGLIFNFVLLPNVSFSAPIRQVGPVTIEGIIQDISWFPEKFIQGIPRMSGSAGVDRTEPAHYQLSLNNIIVSADDNLKNLYVPYKNGDTIEIQLNHPANDNFLKPGMKVRIIKFTQGGDEGGDWTSFKKIEVINPAEINK